MRRRRSIGWRRAADRRWCSAARLADRRSDLSPFPAHPIHV